MGVAFTWSASSSSLKLPFLENRLSTDTAKHVVSMNFSTQALNLCREVLETASHGSRAFLRGHHITRDAMNFRHPLCSCLDVAFFSCIDLLFQAEALCHACDDSFPISPFHHTPDNNDDRLNTSSIKSFSTSKHFGPSTLQRAWIGALPRESTKTCRPDRNRS